MSSVDFEQIERQMSRSKNTSNSPSKQKDPIVAKVMGFMMRNKNGVKTAIIAVILVALGLIQAVKCFILFPIICWSLVALFLLFNYFPKQTTNVFKYIWFPFGVIIWFFYYSYMYIVNRDRFNKEIKEFKIKKDARRKGKK